MASGLCRELNLLRVDRCEFFVSRSKLTLGNRHSLISLSQRRLQHLIRSQIPISLKGGSIPVYLPLETVELTAFLRIALTSPFMKRDDLR